MEKMSIEKAFVYIVLIFGFVFCFLNPPFQAPDENSHFKKAYVVSKGQFYPKRVKKNYGHTIENNLADYIQNNENLNSKLDTKYNFSSMYFDQFIPRSDTSESLMYFSTVDTSFIAYIVPSFGILISKICFKLFFNGGASYLYMLYFARIFNLILYVLLMYIAIKKTPILKKTFIVIGLLPMALYLASSVSYDGLIISCTMLLFAYLFDMINTKEKLSLKSFVPIILTLIILFNIKHVYFPLSLLLILISKDKFENDDKIKILIKVVLIVISSSLILKIPYLLTEGITEINQSNQINWIIHNPLKYTIILLCNMYDQFFNQINTLIGAMGQLDTHLPGIIVIMLSINLFLTGNFESMADCSKIKLTIKQRILNLTILFIICSLIYTGLYILWTSRDKIGGNIIIGVQGRYFIPILIYCFILIPFDKLNSNKTVNKMAKIILENCNFISLIGLIIASLILLLRYWC